MMSITLKQLGGVDENDISFITTEDAKQYMKILNSKCPKSSCEGPTRPYLRTLKNINPQLLELLENMLQINPYQRWSPAECLAQPIFDEIRREVLEKAPQAKISLGVDQDDSYNYEQCTSRKYSRRDYMRMIYKEAKAVQNTRTKILEVLGRK